MRYFVTGATGFLGGHLVRQLRERGHEVVALLRSPSQAGDLPGPGVTWHPGDITDKESMRRGMQGTDGVFHVAAWYKVGVQDDGTATRVNVEGTRNVLELMRELHIPKGVYTSSVAVFSDTSGKVVDETYSFQGTHLSAYDRTKWAAHYQVALPLIAEGLPLVIVLPGPVYGPGDRSRVQEMFVQFLQQKLPLMPLRTAYAWVHVEDVAHGHILAMEKGIPGESYILAGPVYTLVETLQLAERISGVPAPRLQVPPVVLKVLAGLMRGLGKVVRVPRAYHDESLRTIAGVTYAGDSSKARRALGYHPRSLEEGLRETLRYEMERLGMTPPGPQCRPG